MEDVFEEWNVYSEKKVLKSRMLDLNTLESESKIKIIAITGVRRCGKSSVLMLLHQKLKKDNKHVAYINLEDSRIKTEKDVLDNILKWFGDQGYLLLDEITSVGDWEGWLARNHELSKQKLHILVSSSRKNLVSTNKPLRGRILAHELYTLSFKEFLNFNSIKYEKTTAGIGKIEKSLNEYLIYGGFPEIVLIANRTDKVRIINSYFKDIIGLDVAEISKENINVVELFGKYVIETSYFSASKCLNFLKSLGYKIGKQSILNLEKCAQASYLFYFVPIFSYNIKDKAQYPRKTYSGDTGFMYSNTGRSDMGRLFENSIFLELKRRIPQNNEINYWKNQDGNETDFVIREGFRIKEIIQSVYDVDNSNTKEREVTGIIECAKEFNLKKGLIITKDYEGSKIIDGIKIEFLPLWKWLVGE